MKKVLVILLLFFTIKSNLHSMIAPETVQKQPPSRSSTLPKILHTIAYSKRVGKFCSWLCKPISECCKSGRLRSWFTSPQQTSPELGEHPLVKFTKVNHATSTRVSRVKKSVAIISIGLLLLVSLPQAGAFFKNRQDYLKPTICVQNENFNRCCSIEDNMHISCCVTDNLLGIEVCKDYLITMPETASVPFQDLSRIKDQCSADLTPESRMIRQEFDGIVQKISAGESPNILISENLASAPPNFLKKFQESLESIGIPLDAPISIVFPKSSQTESFLDAAHFDTFPTDIDGYSYHRHGPLAILHFRSNLFEYLSVDEIFATVNHELGHFLFKIRNLATSRFQKCRSQDPKAIDFKKHNEEMFADLVGSLLSKKGADQTSFLRQHAALRETSSRLKEDDHVTCAVNNMGGHPPLLCRIAYLDNLQNQLEE